MAPGWRSPGGGLPGALLLLLALSLRALAGRAGETPGRASRKLLARLGWASARRRRNAAPLRVRSAGPAALCAAESPCPAWPSGSGRRAGTVPLAARQLEPTHAWWVWGPAVAALQQKGKGPGHFRPRRPGGASAFRCYPATVIAGAQFPGRAVLPTGLGYM